jgi:hypothetical protein
MRGCFPSFQRISDAMHERPISNVPGGVFLLLAVGVAAQIIWSTWLGAPRARAEDLPAAPPHSAMRLAALGETAALGKLLMLWLQAFDYQSGSNVPYRNLDYTRLTEWLSQILLLDPIGQYPLLTASQLYAEVPDTAKQRQMLDFVYREFLADPDRRWPALAHATVIAKHRLKDLELARTYARALQEKTKVKGVPVWVKQMEFFILEDMNELEAARILLGGLIASGQVRDERDLELLKRRLNDLEMRAGSTGKEK